MVKCEQFSFQSQPDNFDPVVASRKFALAEILPKNRNNRNKRINFPSPRTLTKKDAKKMS